MVPQVSEDSCMQPRVLGEDAATLTGVGTGRPPDHGVIVPVPSKLERMANPVCEEDRQVVKRSRGADDDVMDVGGGVIEGEDRVSALVDDDAGMGCDSGIGSEKNGEVPAKPSFKDMLMGHRSEGSKVSVIPELDVEINAEDVRISSSDGTPMINFSQRLHDLVDEKLSKLVIVRLLGRSIGYSALLNRIKSLWNLCGEVVMIDLDNGYYLIRFAFEEDVEKVLMEGPWLIYGNYLTVQPWSRDFLTDKNHPDKIVVWVRLPGLPYRYYTKSMFRCIAGVIGQIVKIDYNTSEGKRVEYEGLSLICYKCGCYGHSVEVCTGNKNKGDADAGSAPSVPPKVASTEKYGPWMMASGRKSRKAPRDKVLGEMVEVVSPNMIESNGKFDVLAQIEADADGCEGRSISPILSASESVSNGRMLDVDGKRQSAMLEVVSMVPSERSQGENRQLLRGTSSMNVGSSAQELANIEASKVASAGMVVPVSVTLDPKAHVSVRVVEPGKELAPLPRPSRRAYTGAGLAQMKPAIHLPSAKGGEKKGDIGRLKASGRGSSKVRLGEWIGGLDATLVVGDPAKTSSTADGLHKEGEGDGVNVNFYEFLHCTGLNDLGYRGPQFTWKRGTLHQRLDRCVGSDAWCNLWPSSHVLHLSRFGSDHRPILLITDNASVAPRKPLFRYLAAWQADGGFESMLSSAWKSDNSIVHNLRVFQAKASKWNKDSFGHIGRRKRKLLGRIRGLEKVNETAANPHLIELEAKLRDELSDTLRQEQALWYQRARTEWIKDGDRNTKYYHRVTKAKHRQKVCLLLQLDDEQWIYNRIGSPSGGEDRFWVEIEGSDKKIDTMNFRVVRASNQALHPLP
ncbi:hypothetical protein GQ457_05G016040 [Hibiscus cannabinus]